MSRWALESGSPPGVQPDPGQRCPCRPLQLQTVLRDRFDHAGRKDEIVDFERDRLVHRLCRALRVPRAQIDRLAVAQAEQQVDHEACIVVRADPRHPRAAGGRGKFA